jgi:Putative MetA-pathway of phenol degradation
VPGPEGREKKPDDGRVTRRLLRLIGRGCSGRDQNGPRQKKRKERRKGFIGRFAIISAALLIGRIEVACAEAPAPGTEAPAQPAPDKSGYWLLNPTPADQMRDFNTDRPTKSNVPYTVDAGHFQYEADLFNWAYDHWNRSGVTQNTYLFTNPVLKLGLINRSDFEFNFIPREEVRTTVRGGGGTTDVSGFGDVLTRLKINLWGNDGGDSAAALIPFVKWPTAAAGLGGNNQVEGGLIAPINHSLPLGFTLLYNAEVDMLKDSVGNGRHANVINLINLSHPIIEGMTGYVELWSDFNKDPVTITRQWTLDFAVSYVLWPSLPNLQLDIGANVGLSRDAPDLQLYVGIAQRF